MIASRSFSRRTLHNDVDFCCEEIDMIHCTKRDINDFTALEFRPSDAPRTYRYLLTVWNGRCFIEGIRALVYEYTNSIPDSSPITSPR
jgi:hypothetical protein